MLNDNAYRVEELREDIRVLNYGIAFMMFTVGFAAYLLAVSLRDGQAWGIAGSLALLGLFGWVEWMLFDWRAKHIAEIHDLEAQG